MFLPRICITMGDAAGIGPELALWALNDKKIHSVCRPAVIGSRDVLEAVSKESRIPFRASSVSPGDDLPQTGGCVVDLENIEADLVVPGKVSSDCGRAAFEYIEHAVRMTVRGLFGAVVTAPLSKEAMSLAGVPHPGHTEALADLTGASVFAMLQHSREFTVSFATTHIPFSEVCAELTTERIVDVGRLTARFLNRLNGGNPVLGICALNPHAGDGGMFGQEEEQIIDPAIAQLQQEGIDARGPLVSDTAFVRAYRTNFDGFVAMYHDQGHIPFKMLSFHEGVNVTLGLPIVRTSVDHGTAFDIAWEGRANPGSLREALLLAARLCGIPK